MPQVIDSRTVFQSTPSARRATPTHEGALSLQAISIHALREESDVLNTIYSTRANDFNPRPPRGERRCVTPFNYRGTLFQSTPSARRATPTHEGALSLQAISIHALREEGDGEFGELVSVGENFNPRPPRGGRHQNPAAGIRAVLFQSTPSARRATLLLGVPADRPKVFQSTPSARRATGCLIVGRQILQISIHALREEGDPAVLRGADNGN